MGIGNLIPSGSNELVYIKQQNDGTWYAATDIDGKGVYVIKNTREEALTNLLESIDKTINKYEKIKNEIIAKNQKQSNTKHKMSKISMRDLENLKRDLDQAIQGSIPSFYVSLFKSILKADPENLAKLEQVFPTEVALYKRWKEFGIDLSNEELVA